MRTIDHFIAGGVNAAGARRAEVFDPNSGAVQAQVPLGNAADLDRAMAAALAAQPAWAAVTQRWPDGAALTTGSGDGAPSRIDDAFVIPTMG